MKGIGGHQRAFRGKTDEWLTPPEIIAALGAFDLDPCSPAVRPWNTAKRHISAVNGQDGLKATWKGRVWLNPPYGPETGKWLRKLAVHGNGIALIFARTETNMFYRFAFGCGDALKFIRGRLFFYDLNGVRAKHNAGGPSVLIAYGKANVEALTTPKIPGFLIRL